MAKDRSGKNIFKQKFVTIKRIIAITIPENIFFQNIFLGALLSTISPRRNTAKAVAAVPITRYTSLFMVNNVFHKTYPEIPKIKDVTAYGTCKCFLASIAT